MSALRGLAAGLLGLAALLGAAGCLPQPTVIGGGAHSPFTGYSSELYRQDSMWLCRPDLPSNPCGADLSATELKPDGSREVVPFVKNEAPEVDCFFVYPTVDMDPRPGNHTDFADTSLMRRVTVSQAARFQEVCRVFAPLYRQITVGTYATAPWALDRRLEIAYSDVADAFAHYLGQHNGGRRVVLLGHSQGAFMVVELLRHFFDRGAVLEPRLLVGLPIGGRVEVPPGEKTGGTFVNLPLCQGPDEIGCVVAYRSYREGADLRGDPHGPPAGLETGCVHPAGVPGDTAAPIARSYFPTRLFGRAPFATVSGIETPFVLVRGLYSGRCVPGVERFGHLAVRESRAEGDRRPVLFDPADPYFEESTLGLHSIEMLLTQGDLIDLVGRKAAAARGRDQGPSLK